MSDDAAAPALSQLEAALIANGIQVPDGAVNQLLEQREWIYPSSRVEDLLTKLNKEQLYSVFNSQHHIQSASCLFDFLKGRRSCVVCGHKAQGKTQFLFFVFKLLQAMGEKALFLDNTAMSSKESNIIDIDNENFCGNLWKGSVSQIGGMVKDALDHFYQDALPQSFGKFLFALRRYTRESKTCTWIIIDEVVLFENFPIQLPEEQNLGPFKWIVTGSAGIGSWVSKRHLEMFVFDLPLFTKEQCSDFAHKLCNSLSINLANGIDGVPPPGVDDWLEERFGGVIGYIAEMFLEISKGKFVSQYMSSLSRRISTVISNTAVSKYLSKEQLAKDWLSEIKSNRNHWGCLRDAGLCGSSFPRGVIFSLTLKWLCIYAPAEDAFSLVHHFRVRFRTDPGLNGCLLELEEIFKLKASHSFQASLLTLDGQNWIVKECLDLPPRASDRLRIFQYVEDSSILDEISEPGRSQWNMIQVPNSFDVIDVVLVDVSGSPVIYGIQITRSVKPFAKCHTFDTCPPRSKERLEKLWNVISDHFKLVNSAEKFYVMLAPNCEENEVRPPSGHLGNYYFAPRIAGLAAPFKRRHAGKKRRGNDV